ncbi:uncharacterized protein K452DRAFT_55204 [Aplosporella prunicola CBS 121167]|uniref:Uncharacterized protein n=1 Tax=Aplosporella prunicola CBS 121167 TaxID=1176127 RepID=A0A6A6B8W8_9PEZI|nr:uncharacterized protein K452DRAFT_55204 [Aplosporella prunicola CBS 121167]KAF2140396.1 hypothetical protein K452DRAFT_55204 [Aplosporella prunicola CBS 121167]
MHPPTSASMYAWLYLFVSINVNVDITLLRIHLSTHQTRSGLPSSFGQAGRQGRSISSTLPPSPGGAWSRLASSMRGNYFAFDDAEGRICGRTMSGGAGQRAAYEWQVRNTYRTTPCRHARSAPRLSYVQEYHQG